MRSIPKKQEFSKINIDYIICIRRNYIKFEVEIVVFKVFLYKYSRLQNLNFSLESKELLIIKNLLKSVCMCESRKSSFSGNDRVRIFRTYASLRFVFPSRREHDYYRFERSSREARKICSRTRREETSRLIRLGSVDFSVKVSRSDLVQRLFCSLAKKNEFFTLIKRREFRDI